MIIALVGIAALARHRAAGVSLDVPITATLAGATGTGARLRTLAGGRVGQGILARGFALVGAVAVFLLFDVAVLGRPGPLTPHPVRNVPGHVS